MPTIEPALKELRRVLKPGRRAQLMVYHTDSLWLHLYVAYERQLVRRIDRNLALLEAFQKSTDGPDRPISRCYAQDASVKLVSACGFEFEPFGAAVSAWEMSLLHKRYAAIMNPRLPRESRKFLAGLTFDERGLPSTRTNVHAGIDGCYLFRAV